MGSLNTKDFQEMFEDDMPPPTPVKIRCMEEDFDPRSPTLGITRTPIQIMKVPQQLDDPRSPTVGIERTPICPLQVKPRIITVNPMNINTSPAPVLDDPRSPTTGISRTPICYGKKGTFNDETLQQEADTNPDVFDPRSPTQGILRTPICSTIKDILGNSPVSDSLNPDIENTNFEDLDDMLSEPIKMSLNDQMEAIAEQLHSDLVMNCPVLDHDLKQHEPEKETKPPKKISTKKTKSLARTHTNVDTTDLTNDYGITTIKDKTVSTRSPLKVIGDRSPLSSRNVDYNSPRAIVQRKQSGKLALKKAALQMKPLTMKNSPKYKTMDEEKENL